MTTRIRDDLIVQIVVTLKRRGWGATESDKKLADAILESGVIQRIQAEAWDRCVSTAEYASENGYSLAHVLMMNPYTKKEA